MQQAADHKHGGSAHVVVGQAMGVVDVCEAWWVEGGEGEGAGSWRYEFSDTMEVALRFASLEPTI